MPLPTLAGGGYPLNDSRNFTKSTYEHSLTNAYGAYAVSYSLTTTHGTPGTETIQRTDWQAMADKAKLENTRRGKSAAALTIPTAADTKITSLHLSTIVDLFNVSDDRPVDQAYNTNGSDTVTTFGGHGQPGFIRPVSSYAPGAVIYASTINTIASSIIQAGSICTCNCNYCTCNCNYCTCNCNYACTCDCNYH